MVAHIGSFLHPQSVTWLSLWWWENTRTIIIAPTPLGLSGPSNIQLIRFIFSNMSLPSILLVIWLPNGLIQRICVCFFSHSRLRMSTKRSISTSKMAALRGRSHYLTSQFLWGDAADPALAVSRTARHTCAPPSLFCARLDSIRHAYRFSVTPTRKKASADC